MTDSHGHVTGKRIILEIVREMRDGLHPLLYSRVAPGLYCVYLHPEDFSRLEGLVPRIRAEAQRALAEEMRRLNDARPQGLQGLRWFVAAETAPPIDVPAQGWEIQIEPDRDDEVAPGTFVILSRLTLSALPQFEGSAATMKVFKTVIAGETRTKTEQVFQAPRSAAAPAMPPAAAGGAPAFPESSPASRITFSAPFMPPGVPASGAASLVSPPPPLPASPQPLSPLASSSLAGAAAPALPSDAPVTGTLPTGDRSSARTLAQIAVQDARGPRLFVMDKPDIKIGRGGQFRIVDLQIDGPTRISRVHARIRRDEQGRFFIKDLSEWGTTVNGQRIARGVIKEGDEIREIDVEAELPSRARIGLAESLFLEFVAAEQTTGVFSPDTGAAV